MNIIRCVRPKKVIVFEFPAAVSYKTGQPIAFPYCLTIEKLLPHLDEVPEVSEDKCICWTSRKIGEIYWLGSSTWNLM
jgi:hypothetical protein